jgi:hypothetical protein
MQTGIAGKGMGAENIFYRSKDQFSFGLGGLALSRSV